VGNRGHSNLPTGVPMKQFIKDFYEIIKAVQQARAEAVLKGQHWI